MATTVDKRVKELFDQVRKDKAAIGKAEKPNWRTNLTFGYSPNSANDRINIQVETDLRKLTDILAFLTARRNSYIEAAEMLGTPKAFKWMGFSVKEWGEDILTRVNMIQLTKKKQELATLEARLNNLLSPELKQQMELDAIEEEMSKSKKKDAGDDEEEE